MLRSLPALLCAPLLVACGVFGPEPPFVGGDSQVSRADLLMLCELSCEVQAEGEMCTPEPYLGWCVENCRSIDGLIPEHCRAEAAEAFTCWAVQPWTCLEGSELQLQPQLLDPEACADEEQRYWLCA